MTSSKKENIHILITGAAGFVGANLVYGALERGMRVVGVVRESTDLWRLSSALSNPHFTLIKASVTDKKALGKTFSQPFDVVIHAAVRGAYPDQNEIGDVMNATIDGTQTLLEVMTEHKPGLFISMGSSSEYGRSSTAMKEDQTPLPESYYAVGKWAAGQMALVWARQTGVPTQHVRLFSVFGPFEEKKRLFPTLLAGALNGQQVSMANPTTARDFIAVEDVVRACLDYTQELRELPPQVLNIGTGEQLTLKQIVAAVEQLPDSRLSVEWGAYPDRVWDTSRWVADMSQTFSVLSWRPTSALKSGLPAMWKWYKKHHELYAK